MSIAVFYLRNSEPEGQTPAWQSQCQAFTDAQMGEALALCQLLRKDQTDTALLEEIIVANLGQQEFFINKAIGWALRDYSKTDPGWVRAFIGRHRDGLAPLSVREASKYL